MAKMHFNPFGDFEEIWEAMDRLMSRGEASPAGPRTSERGYFWQPAMDVFETESGITLQVELPGIPMEEITIEMRGESLWIYGQRRFERDVEEACYQMIERSYGPFAREFKLPRGVDASAIRAVLRTGLLTLTIPRREPGAGNRRIRIDVG